MKIYIFTDLEGPALISRWDQTRDVTPEDKRRSMQLLTGEINACVDGIRKFDSEAEVVVWDGHGSGGIDEMMIHPDARLIMRGPIKAPYFLDESYDAVMFVGQHAMKSAGSTLCHTYSSKTIAYFKINGVELGEFGCRALLAGTMGVPTVFIAGDDVAVKEAKALIPNIVGADVKKSLGEQLALHRSHQAACNMIRKRAAKACKRIKDVSPYFMPGPYTQEIRLLEGANIDHLLKDGFEQVDELTARKTCEDFGDLRWI